MKFSRVLLTISLCLFLSVLSGCKTEDILSNLETDNAGGKAETVISTESTGTSDGVILQEEPAGAVVTPEPTATPTAEPTATPVPTAVPEPTATPIPTATPTPEPTPVPDKDAERVSIGIETPTGEGRYDLKDGKYASKVSFGSGDTIRVTSEEDMYGAYIIWGYPSIDYSLTYNGKTVSGGELGILHDYVEFDGPTREFVITTLCFTSICDIYAYSDGRLPADVQRWERPCEKADMLVFSTHADDEVLFFGGAIIDAVTSGYDVQVVYLAQYWEGDYGDPRREHEKLDGLWTMGVRHYPVNMPFLDEYSTSLEGAKKVYDYDEICRQMTANIRRFKPEVLVTHDIDGEYGHGGHMIVNAAARDIIEATGKADYDTGSADEYGPWDVPKTYFHLYGENRLRLDLRQPLEALGGRTALEVETEAYKKHESQQWCWFYVSDDYEYSCADFGLYRSTVGADTGNNMMEHINDR